MGLSENAEILNLFALNEETWVKMSHQIQLNIFSLNENSVWLPWMWNIFALDAMWSEEDISTPVGCPANACIVALNTPEQKLITGSRKFSH